MQLRPICSDFFDRLVCPDVYLLHRSWSAFKVWGYVGLTLAIFLGIALTMSRGFSLWVLAGLVLAAAGTFFGLAMVTKVSTGKEQLIYYHHEIAITAAVAYLVWMLGQPVLPYLDITILGLGVFLAFGRIGCFMVGCCHGRPHRWGVCYRHGHAKAGFPQYLIGIRLFPIQAVESLFVFGVVGVGTWVVLTGHPPGEALAWYVVTYGVARFFFEFTRGDTGRPELFGFSEAQWTSLILMNAGLVAEWSGLISLHPWHAWATAGLVLSMILVGFVRHVRQPATYRLLQPSHIREVAKAIEVASHQAFDTNVRSARNVDPGTLRIGQTSLGVQITMSRVKRGADDIEHYALSSQGEVMTEKSASTVALLILQLRHISAPHELICGSHGVFHVLIHHEEKTTIARCHKA